VFRLRPALLAMLVLTLAAGCAERNQIPEDLRTALEKGDSFELYSLNPDRTGEEVKDGFHGWRVLGKTTIKDAETRKKLLTAFQKGVAENKGIAAGCFNPRHGIRVTHDGKTFDFVICFECYSVAAHVGDKREAGFLITESPQPTFDAVLKEAKVPLPTRAKDD
jgi:hypothetical protein